MQTENEYSPKVICEYQAPQPEIRIKALLEEEFTQLGKVLRERMFANAIKAGYKFERLLEVIHIWRVSQELIDFSPIVPDYSSPRRKYKRESHVFVFDDNWEPMKIVVGERKKYCLVSKPTFWSPLSKWKVEKKSFLFQETIGQAVNRLRKEKNKVRFIVQLGSCEKEYRHHWQMIIWRVPKAHTLETWLESERQRVRDDIRSEALAESRE
jgi:hypothetical protein